MARFYRARDVTWERFCQEYAGISRSVADQLIRQLDEFGPGYFHIAEIAKITPEKFRLIAPSVSEEGVNCDGESIPFTAENAGKLAAAVQQLQARAEAGKPPAAAEEPGRHLEHAARAFTAALAELERARKLPRNLVERQTQRAVTDSGIQQLTRLTGIVPNH